MKAGDGEVAAALQDQVAELTALGGLYYSLKLPSGEVIAGLQTLENLKERMARFPLPEDLTGKRVLDLARGMDGLLSRWNGAALPPFL